jgi:hypothetical protein
MKVARRNFLHLAAGAVALPAVSRVATAQPIRQCASSSDLPRREIACNNRAAHGGDTECATVPGPQNDIPTEECGNSSQ